MASKTYCERLARKVREILPDDTEFVVEADPPYWIGYLFVFHPNGVVAAYLPLVADKRAAVTKDSVRVTLRHLAMKMFPDEYYTPTYRGLKREAHSAWVAQTGIEEHTS